jgi:hypothetical protein
MDGKDKEIFIKFDTNVNNDNQTSRNTSNKKDDGNDIKKKSNIEYNGANDTDTNEKTTKKTKKNVKSKKK